MKTRALTLIEILIIVAIVAILLTLIIKSTVGNKSVEQKDAITLPDGTPVECYTVSRGLDKHYIYVVRGAKSVSNNYETGGKNKTHHVETTIEK